MNALLSELSLGAAPIILCIGAMLLLLIDVFSKAEWARGAFAGNIVVLSLVACAFNLSGFQAGSRIFQGFIFADPYALFVTVLILAGSLFGILLGLNKLRDEGIESTAEYYALYLMATAGAIWFATSAELIMLFLALEIMSMALYCLCGAAYDRKVSSEAALKYFFLGSFSSAFLLFGIAILYGVTGSTDIAIIGELIIKGDQTLSLIGLGLIIIGLAFKIGAVPFHYWAPDVYQGAPTPVTAFMACAIKASAFAAAFRVIWTGFGAYFTQWSGLVWTLALLTMVIGNLIALRQRSVKRMLAYSSIAHAGYVLMALLAPTNDFGGGPGALYYLVSYTLMTMGAFGALIAISSRFSSERHADNLSRFNGLSTTQPLLAALFTLFLLSLAGLPPGMAGLMGKVYVFSAVVKAGYPGLAILGILSSAVSCYYYLRVIVAMYFIEGDEESRTLQSSIGPNALIKLSMALCAFGVVYFGLFPSGLYRLAEVAVGGM